MPRERRPHVKLYANRRAGWDPAEWHALDDWALKAGVRSYALTAIEELDPVIALSISKETGLLLVFGGDGTLMQVLNSWIKHHGADKVPIIVPIGGGTMKRLPRRTLWNGTPAENAEIALELFESNCLPHLSLPLLKVEWGKQCCYAVTFMAGAPVRVMHQYSRFKTTPFVAGAFVLGSVTAGLVGWPKFFTNLYGQIQAKVIADGKLLTDQRFIVIIKDVFPKLIFFIEPYRGISGPGQSFSLAYAIDSKETAKEFWRLCVGLVPKDDERYFNQPTGTMQIEPLEEIPFTLDGEYFTALPGEAITISYGPSVQVAVNPFIHLTFVNRLTNGLRRLREVASYIIPTPRGD